MADVAPMTPYLPTVVSVSPEIEIANVELLNSPYPARREVHVKRVEGAWLNHRTAVIGAFRRAQRLALAVIGLQVFTAKDLAFWSHSGRRVLKLHRLDSQPWRNDCAHSRLPAVLPTAFDGGLTSTSLKCSLPMSSS